mmetsp:Transcript_9010/g.21475  ORF Transcript_9010/g.21475 Transcript_9010/m.21475 type:complete len:518 (-) Transcript_9010:188-1741(-)
MAMNNEAEVSSRQMFDKNTLRRMHSNMFLPALQRFRAELPPVRAEEVNPKLSVYVRKRPLFQKEADKGEFDTICALAPAGENVSGSCVVHNCLFQADLKTPYVNETAFAFDGVFDENCTTEQVYDHTARDLVNHALHGGVSSLLMFGQTGSGKTHTLTGIEELTAHDLFSNELAQGSVVTFLEIAADKIYDLLAEGRPDVVLRADAKGNFVLPREAIALEVFSTEECLSIMRHAHKVRATQSTDANDTSSRSHAICIIRFRSGGSLMLTDLAGSERSKDSMYHTKERQREGAEINASLHALKECIRSLAEARGDNYGRRLGRGSPDTGKRAKLTTQNTGANHIPFRASSLTKLMMEAFTSPNANLAVICTVSPCASDTEHSIGTLRTGFALSGRPASAPYIVEKRRDDYFSSMRAQQGAEARARHPKRWDAPTLQQWLKTVQKGVFADVAGRLPANTTGAMFSRFGEQRLVQLCNHEQAGRRLYKLLRAEMDASNQAQKENSSPSSATRPTSAMRRA